MSELQSNEFKVNFFSNEFAKIKSDDFTLNKHLHPIKPDFYFINRKIEKSYTPIETDGTLDINSYLVKNDNKTFIIRVTGDSMLNAGIESGDLLIVDKAIQPENGMIVIASINNCLLVKKLVINIDSVELAAENKNYPNIKIQENDDLNIWGVVTSVIKCLV